MRSARPCCIVLVTGPDIKTARELSRAALRSRLVACANLVPGVESHYWWRKKLESSREVLIVFKTTKPNLPALEKLVLTRHPYDTPEMIVLTLNSGTARYLNWITA